MLTPGLTRLLWRTERKVEAANVQVLNLVNVLGVFSAVVFCCWAKGFQLNFAFVEYYGNAEIQFMSLANIHSIRRSFHALRALCSYPADQVRQVSNEPFVISFHAHQSDLHLCNNGESHLSVTCVLVMLVLTCILSYLVGCRDSKAPNGCSTSRVC